VKSKFFLYKKLGLFFLPLFLYGCSTAIKTYDLNPSESEKTSDPKTYQSNNSSTPQTKDYLSNEEPGIPYFLPTNLIEIKVTRTPIKKDNTKDSTIGNLKTIEYTMEAKPIFIPDTNTRFLLQHEKRRMASDRLCVARSTTGLLQYVQFATDDKSDQILVKISELAAKIAWTAIAPVPAVPAAAARAATKIEEKEVKSAIAIAIANPSDKEFEESLRTQIKRVLPEIERIYFPDSKSLNFNAPRKCPEETICFSTLTQAPLLLEGDFNVAGFEGEKFNAATTVSVVDFKHVGKLRVDRPFLVDQVTKLGFTEGVLTSMAFKQPSEGLAIVSLPLDILDAILAVPANFFSTALGGIFSNQKALLEQQKELTELQQKIRHNQNEDRKASTDTADTDTNFALECTSLSKKN
jgi:hypothetical protein